MQGSSLTVRRLETPPGAQEVEVVERKGLGHPDTICDAVSEHVCVRLCRYYLEHFGVILHHNVDKVLLCGGSARAAFAAGEILEPIEIYIGGRAALEYRGKSVPIHEIAAEACKEWLRKHLPKLDTDRNVKIISRLRGGSTDLVRLFDKNSAVVFANDTSCGAGFAPLTDLEKVVLQVERELNSPDTKRARPEMGEDIKVMGIRRNKRIALTVGCAFISRFTRSIEEYAHHKITTKNIILKTARRFTSLEVDAAVNAADDFSKGDVFLTVTGTSAEAGDDGETGRGNRACGLITPYRVMTLEAAAGKNPVSHVGKLYNLAAGRLAAAIVAQVEDITDAECVAVSKIGHAITSPDLVDVQLCCKNSANIESVRKRIGDIAFSEFEHIGELRHDLLNESFSLY